MSSIPPTPQHAASTSSRSWQANTLVYSGAGLFALFAWLLWGDFAWQMKERAAAPVAQLMLRQFHASDFLVGLLLGSLPSALGLIIGPIVSVRSDRHRGPHGRRIPYLLVPTPFIVLGMAGLAYTPEAGVALHSLLGERSPGADACRLIAFTFFWGLFEVFTLIANAVFGGLINDVVPQALIGRFFGLFRAVSLVAGVIFNFWLIGHAEEHFRAIFLGIGLLYGVGLTLMCLRVKEGSYPPLNHNEKSDFIAETKGYLRDSFSNPFYLWLFVALMLGALAGGPVNSFSIFYAKSINMDMSAYGRLLVVTYIISFALSFFIGWLADRFHPLRVAIVSVALYAGMMLWAGFAATDTVRFSAAFVAHGVLQGTFMTGTASLGQRLFPAARFAQFASAAGILGSVGYILLPPITGALLDASGHVYRLTFTASGIIGVLALGAYLVVYRRFQRLGGDLNYTPPS